MDRRSFLQGAGVASLAPASLSERPNILLAIVDDQGHIHSSPYGCRGLSMPNCDRIAGQGVRFTNAFSSGPMCTVSRAALLTGRNIWQNREAGTHWSNFPRDLPVYPDLLAGAGYHCACTGKGWGPGEWEVRGWPLNPAGLEYNQIKLDKKPPFTGISDIDYAANFAAFLQKKPAGRPFCFWFGPSEAHGPWHQGSGVKSGKKLDSIDVPPNFPKDTPEVRGWLLDYFVELEYFDRQLGRMLEVLEKSGEAKNTLLVITGDNGSPMMRAKCNLYDFGTHVPLLASWPGRIPAGRVVEDLVAFIDLAPTFLDLAGVKGKLPMTGRSLRELLLSGKSGRLDPSREYVLTGHERGSHELVDHLGYPMRAIRDYRHLYIQNLKSDRWPRGDPRHFPEMARSPDGQKRPPEELFDVTRDPACLHNLAADAGLAPVKAKLRRELEQRLTAQKDPRMLGYGDIWESYPRYGPFKPQIEGFNKRGEYNPKYQVKTPQNW